MTIQDLLRKFALSSARAVANLVDDTTDFQTIQVSRLADEVTDAERIGEYGLTSNPPEGSEAVILSIGGVRSHAIAIAVGNRQYRVKGLKQGEVALHDDQGQVVLLGRDGITIETDKAIDISAPEITVTANHLTLDADQVDVSGDVSIAGALKVDGQWTLGSGAGKPLKHSDDTPTTSGVAT